VTVRRVVLATGNRDKVRELQNLFAAVNAEVVPAFDLGDAPDVVEDGQTLEANALKKAREIAAWCGQICVADDTGLEVDALDGAPGVYAARYAGEDASYADNCSKLVSEMAGQENRSARFRTVMAMVDPSTGAETTVDGVLEGEVLGAPRGGEGFGYDPVFFVPEQGRSLAEMSLEEKNQISHRARAARAMAALLVDYLE
jgi:XTP/dITP diphosphohydrolase